MINKIRFLVLWVGTRCTLKCKDCCNLIPYLRQRSYETNNVIENLNYITKEIEIELLQIQGGEPFTHKDLDKIILSCVNNEHIHRIEIASNGTIMLNEKIIELVKKYQDKVTVRFSDYMYGKKNRKSIEQKLLKNYGLKVEKYDFIYDTGEWFDLGGFERKKEGNIKKIKQTYENCPNKSCWTLADNYFAGCGRMISYLELYNETIDGNNILDILKMRNENQSFKSAFQVFEKNYRTGVSDLCGYCEIGEQLIPAGIQLKQDETKKYR